MIVLLTGAGGTGKTTLADLLSKSYGVPFLKSTSREVQRSFGILNEDQQLTMTPEALAEVQDAITRRYWEDSREAAKSERGYISDRTLADHFTYRRMKGWTSMDESELAWYWERVEQQFVEADLVIYTPTGYFTPPDDGMRTTDEVQRDIFDTIIRGTIERLRHKINWMALTVGDLETRLRHIHSALLNVHAIEPASDKEARLVR